MTAAAGVGRATPRMMPLKEGAVPSCAAARVGTGACPYDVVLPIDYLLLLLRTPRMGSHLPPLGEAGVTCVRPGEQPLSVGSEASGEGGSEGIS